MPSYIVFSCRSPFFFFCDRHRVGQQSTDILTSSGAPNRWPTDTDERSSIGRKPNDSCQIVRPMTFYQPIVGRQSPDICHLSPSTRRTDGRSRATVPTYISIRLHYAQHILCHGVCGNASVVGDGGKKRIVQLLEPYYLYWMRGHPKVDGRKTIENTYRLLFFCFFFVFLC